MTKPALIEILTTNGGIDITDAEHVIRVYRKAKVLTLTAHDGYCIVHGALFDADVIARAVNTKV